MRFSDGSIIYGLKNLLVQHVSFLRFKRNFHLLKSIRQSLNTDANRSVPFVGVLRLLDGIVIDINYLIQITSDNASYLY